MADIRLPDKPTVTSLDKVVGIRNVGTGDAVVLVDIEAIAAQVSVGGGLAQATWAQLSAISGSTNGQAARVIGDAGTHTDPVVGGTVANEGHYGWYTSPAGWRWLGALDVEALNDALDAETAARIAADALKAPLASPTFTGTVAAPTATTGDNTTKVATTAFVTTAVAAEATARSAADDVLAASIALKAPLASPTLTGVPVAPTAAPGTNTTQLSTTAFVTAAVAVETTARSTADSALTTSIDLKAPLASPTFTGTPAAPTATGGDSSTQIATTAFVAGAVADEATARATAVSGEATARAAADTALTNSVALKAPLASPTFTGVPAAPTAAGGTSTTQIATTAFVAAAVTTGVTSEATARADADTALTNSVALKAPLASPTFTGTPAAPTAAPGVSTTQIATTAFVADAVTTAVAAEATTRAAADTATTTALALKAPLASPTFTGTVAAPTATTGDNTTKVATTAFVTTAVAAEATARSAADDVLAASIALKAPLASPTLTGVPVAPTAAPGTNTTQLSTTAFVTAAVAVETTARSTADTALTTSIDLKAPLASPTFTGTPAAPTATGGDSSTQIATTAFVAGAVADEATARATAVSGEATARAAADTALTNSVALKAPLASPALTGAPTAPTAAGGTNTTQVATTAFVHGEVATETAARNAADTALDTKFTRLETASNAGVFFPGIAPEHFTSSTTGAPESTTALNGASTANTTDGRAYRVIGAGIVAMRAVAWLKDGRSFKCRSVYKRSTNSADPNNDAVQTILWWMAGDFSLILEQTIFTDSAATVSAGQRVQSYDLPTPPAGAVYVRLGVKTYGSDSATDIYEESIEDITALGDIIDSPTIYLGTWNATTNSPAIQSGVGTAGHYYIVSVAGSTAIDGISAWGIGDEIVFNGATWEKIANTGNFVTDFAPSDSTDGGPFIWALLDVDGNVLFGVNALGQFVFNDAVMEPSAVADDQIGETVLLRTMTGTLLSINARTGRLMCDGIEIAYQPEDAQRSLIPIVRTLAGVPLGIDPDGGTYLKISKFAETWLPPATMFGTPGVFNIRVDGERGIVGTMQDIDGYTCDVYRQRMISSTTTVAIETEIQADLCIGQSHAGAESGPTGGPTWDGNTAPNHILMIQNSLEHGGDGLWSSFAKPTDDFIPLAQPTGYGQSILDMALEALVRFERDAGIRNEPRVGMVSWRGSTAIEYFFPGSAPGGTPVYMHENALEMVRRAKAVAGNYPVPFKLAVLHFIQGENPGATAATWYDSFASYIDTVVPLYTAAAGQSAPPRILIVQTGTGTNSTPNDNPLGQIAIARDRGSPAVSVVGPMYPYRVHAGGTTGIQSQVHIDDPDRMMLGEITAIARDRVVRQGLAWNPLWPVAGGVTRVDNVITIPLVLPPGCTALAFETDYVGTSGVTNKGFVFSQTGGNSPVIQSVAIDGTNIVVTLDVTPTGTDMKIDYARANNTGTVGWMTGRGTLYTPDARQSVWYRRGYAVHPNPRHYCVSFSENVP